MKRNRQAYDYGKCHGGAAAELQDVRIAGSDDIGSGVYGRIVMSGSGTVKGDVEAKEIAVSGSSKFEGRVKAGKFRASGSCSVDGDLEATDLRSSGSMSVGGDVAGESVSFSGSVGIGGDLRAEIFHASGSLRIGGSLKSARIDFTIWGRSQARSFEGKEIRVVKARRNKGGKLHVEKVDGDDVHLEMTVAELVRGKRVVVGRESKVERVEYHELLEVHEEAQVGERIKL